MDLKTVLTILRRRFWVIALTTAATLVVVVVGTLLATPIYAASATMRVAVAIGGTGTWGDAYRLINTYTQMATSRPVLDGVVEQLALAEPPDVLVQPVNDTELIKVVVQDPDPKIATDAANTLAEILVARSKEMYSGGAKSASAILSEQMTEVERQLRQSQAEYDRLLAETPQNPSAVEALRMSIALTQGIYGTLVQQYERARTEEELQANALSIVEPAIMPEAPVRPKKMQNLILGAVAGLMAGVTLALVFEHMDTGLRTVAQIEEVTALHALGTLPDLPNGNANLSLDGSMRQAEAYRRLRSRIDSLMQDSGAKTLLVTSAIPGEGKSTLVANLARAVADSGRRVVAVDGDLRRPTLKKAFGVKNGTGLDSVLTNGATLQDALQYDARTKVWLLTCDARRGDPTLLLGSQRMRATLQALAQAFDLVLVDSPAILAVGDAIVLAPLVDEVLLVVSHAEAKKETVMAACQQLTDSKANVAGVVVNRAMADGFARYETYYQYNGNT